MHIENTTKGRDLSPATDELWKKFYVRQFGIESANLVVERMGQKRVIFKWKQLYEAKLKDREEATQKSLDRIKKRYQEEDATMSTWSSTTDDSNTTRKTPVITSMSGGDIFHFRSVPTVSMVAITYSGLNLLRL
ncbi:uncharacterized protein [Primulina huaijiensis]|uniref:uncharacterized protein isoform X3 n=1 Tax=Primulina huaijiensis TaxID=1492673 RepID=UPI003CC72D70